MEKINLHQKFSLFNEYWNPKIAGELNNQQVKLVKFKGGFVWHKHDKEDEFFFVVKGKFVMQLRNADIELKEGEFLIVPRGTEHKPVAEDEVWVMLFEPASTLNTGDVQNEKTQATLERI